jgi:hypothetical protein
MHTKKKIPEVTIKFTWRENLEIALKLCTKSEKLSGTMDSLEYMRVKV